MKFNIIKWYRFKKYIQNNPNLIDDTYKLNMKDVQDLLDNEEPLSFEDMIKAAMLKSTIPTRKWEKSVRALRKKARIVRRKKRLLALAASLSVIILFFTATPIGRAWAKSAIDWVIQIFENKIVVENANNDISIEYDNVSENPNADLGTEQIETENYASIEQFYQNTKLNPVIINDSNTTIKEVIYQDESADGALITVIYSSEKWGELVTNQIWSSGEGLISGFEDEYFIASVLNCEYDMYCCINPDDDLFEGRIFSDQFLFTVGFKNQDDNDEIISSIQFYH